MKEQTRSLRSLVRMRNIARGKLHQVMSDNEFEWQVSRKILEQHEIEFVTLWEAYKTDRNYIEEKFFACCDNLLYAIYQKNMADKKFKKIYKPYYDKFQKLNQEYELAKSQQSKKGCM